MGSRLPDRRFQSCDHHAEQSLAREAGSNIPGVASSVCLVHHPGVIGTAVKQWLIDLGFGSSPKRKAAKCVFPLMSGPIFVFFLPAWTIAVAWCLRSYWQVVSVIRYAEWC
jgi:hypothetical protein